MAKADGTRAARVGERIRSELMELLLRGAVKDPGAVGAVVHGVEVTGDLRQAKVFVRLDVPDVAEIQQKRLVRAMKRASGFLRREVGTRLRLKHSPELIFVWDDTAERAARLEALLEEIRPEPPGEDT